MNGYQRLAIGIIRNRVSCLTTENLSVGKKDLLWIIDLLLGSVEHDNEPLPPGHPDHWCPAEHAI